jgi:uncharacterized protein YdhG (YjbR/CyaY superfamily)
VAQITAEVDAYLDELQPERSKALEAIRSLILDSVPGVAETMRYRMPTYELDEVVCSFASQKHYMSLYMDTSLVEKYREELKPLDCGKSCIRFKKLDELPLDTVKRILLETVRRQSQ